MNLSKIKIKNFLSIKEAELDFTNYSGLIQIKGDNLDERRSNGAGKSSIFEAVIFGLFGRTIRGLNEDDLVNSESNSNLCVDLIVRDIRIIRGKKPSILRVFKNDEEQRLYKYYEHCINNIIKHKESSYVLSTITKIKQSCINPLIIDDDNIIKKYNLPRFSTKGIEVINYINKKYLCS